jgi:hypothetical protein
MDVVPKSIVLHGKLLFCLGSGDTELRVIDLSDPALPKQVGSYNPGSSGTSMAIAQDYLFIADHYRGVQVFDITVPTTPQLLGVYATEGSASSLVLQGDYVFLADGTALEVINIADPGRPTRVARLKMAAREVTAVPNYAYVVTSDLEIIDISSPTNPQKVGSYTTPGGVLSFTVAGTYGFVGTDHGLEIIDLSNPGAPHKVGSFAGERTYSVAVNGNHAFASLSEQNGFLALDISDAANPKRASIFITSAPVRDIFISEGKAYLGEFSILGAVNNAVQPGMTLEIVNVANPADPRWLGAYRSFETAFSVKTSGDYVFAASGSLQVIDVAVPAKPHLAGQFSAYHVMDVVIRGNRVYLAAGDHGLRILRLMPLVRSLSRQGHSLQIHWQGFGPSHLEKGSDLNPDFWQPVPGSGATNSILLPMTASAEFFRAVAD